MGNQASASHHHAAGASHPAAAVGGAVHEPLESFSKEKERDDHLKNLGFKRSKSLRKSIAKRLKRHRKRDPEDLPDGPTSLASKPRKTSEASLEPRIEIERPPAEKTDRPLVGQPQPLPAHVQDLSNLEGARPRTMDKLRKSFRASLKKKKDLSQSLDPVGDQVVKAGDGGSGVVAKQWQADEVAVRSGLCHFQVKYLGCVEVFNSRGMDVCEEAVKVLKNSKRKSVRSVLYVSGDGLRVVDDETRGLILDQTIEKVSFCAPDRNYDRGFSYICRDGTTRRWMCHGFMAVKDSGERLSHAVGCAFAICLERKQKRDSDCTVSVSFDNQNSTFTRFGSFRQATITERLQDPQVLKPAQPPPLQEKEDNPFAIARPHAPDLMLARQTSFRGFTHLQASGNSPFKRQLSLRLTDLPSTLERQKASVIQLGSLDPLGKDLSLDLRPSPMGRLTDVAEESEAAVVASEAGSEIDKMCQRLSSGLANLSSGQNSKPPFANGAGVDHMMSDSNSTRNILSPRSAKATSPLPPISENFPLQPTTTTSVSSAVPSTTTPAVDSAQSATNGGTRSLDSFLASVKPMEYDNPWDWVPDQPLRSAFNASKASTSSNCDSTSSGVSSGSLASIGGSGHPRVPSIPPPPQQQQQQQQTTDQNTFSNKNSSSEYQNLFSSKSLFDHHQHQNHQVVVNTTLSNGNADKPTNPMFEDFFWSSTVTGGLNNSNHQNNSNELETTATGILEDPFDAEWAALAMRNSTSSISSKNPFIADKPSEAGLKKAFELQM